MSDQPVDFCGEIDEAAAARYFFDYHTEQVDPVAVTAPGDQPNSLTHPSVANQESREPGRCQAVPQPAAKRASRAESNRRWQKKFREKQRTKWQRMQEEVNTSAAAGQQLQEEKQRLAAELELLKSPATERRLSNLDNSTHNIQPASAGHTALAASPWPYNQVSDKCTFAHSILYCAWSARSTDKWTSTVHHTAEVMSMYQDYAREVAICLAIGGETLKHNLETASGQRVSLLMDVLGSLCAAEATYDFQNYAAFMGHALLPGADTESTDTQSHWLQLAHTLHFNDSQLEDLFLLRQAYLQQQANLLHEQQDLEGQLKDRNNSVARCTDAASAGECTVLQDSYQISECSKQLQEAYIIYKGIIYDGGKRFFLLYLKDAACVCTIGASQ